MSIRREPAFLECEYRRRASAVHARMREHGLDGLVLFGPHNINYLTGMDSENLFDPQACIVAVGSHALFWKRPRSARTSTRSWWRRCRRRS
jgi:Xaa-Pro aminopeptidase